MKIKTFHGKSMVEALDEVKRHFGRDAVILSTRTLGRGGILHMGRKPYVEITAARQMSDLPPAIRRGTIKARSREVERAEGAATQVSPTVQPVPAAPSDALLAEVGALKTLVSDLVHETRRSQVGDLPDTLYDCYRRLVENEVAEQLAQQLVKKVQSELPGSGLGDAEAVRLQLSKALESMLPSAGPIRLKHTSRPTVVALVGPTGVGKTTTVAKLAANFCLREHRKVGLITIDTYRIAAVEQLRTYAQIIDIPLDVAVSPDQLKDALARMEDREIILIDTAGRSQRDEVKIKELSRFFSAVQPDEVHLLLSAACAEVVLTETIERFAVLGVNRVIFTKLDEAIGFGVALTCLQKAKSRLSYVTTGQDVPDDIEVGRGKALAKLILEPRLPHCTAPSGAGGSAG